MRILVIAEKPMLRKAIADAIPGKGSGSDPVVKTYNGDEYTITNVYGHVLQLKMPEDYDPAYKKWDLSALPIYFENWEQKPSPTAKEKVVQLKDLIKNADMIIHAGDPDDEGQYLIDEILRWYKYKGPVKRLDTANTTLAGMQKALSKMTDNTKHINDGLAAHARAISDLIVGVNMSRYYTLISGGATLTVGRVQTPTLGLVVARDALIEGHNKSKYYVVAGNMDIKGNSIPFTLQMKKTDPRLDDGKLLNKSEAEAIKDRIANKSYSEIIINKKKEIEQPPLPFNLVKLQTYCGSKFNYDPKKVMDITQALRDKYSAITYNRSDCQYLSSDHFAEAPSTTATVCANIGYTPKELDTNIKSKAFNDKLITAHFAIIPTDSKQDISKFTQDERNVYLAICKYYLAQFLPPAEKLKTSMKKEVQDGVLSSTSTEITKPGYRAIFKDAKEEEKSVLSEMPAGMYDGQTDDCEIQEKETKPPARYTKTSLNEDMTRISKYVDDPEIKKMLLAKDAGKEGENGSIGTTATRPDIIENLIKRGYLEEQGKKIISTKLGREFYNALPDELKKPDMTAKWWAMQEQIKAGEIDYTDLPESVLETCKDIMNQKHERIAAASTGRSQNGRQVLGKCPKCGKDVILTKKGGAVCVGFMDKSCDFGIYGTIAEKKLTPTQLSTLITAGHTKTIKGFKSKSGKTFDAPLKLDETYKVKFDFQETDAASRESEYKCPKCGRPLIYTRNGGVSCSGYKDGVCDFGIYGTIAGKQLSREHINQLLEDRKTDTINGFVSKAGKKFSAALELTEENKIAFVFPERSDDASSGADSGLKCPKCGQPLFFTKTGGVVCKGKFDGACDFGIYGTVAGKKLTEKQITSLIENGKTGVIKGFKSKAGKKFDAALTLAPDGTTKFEFEQK